MKERIIAPLRAGSPFRTFDCAFRRRSFVVKGLRAACSLVHLIGPSVWYWLLWLALSIGIAALPYEASAQDSAFKRYKDPGRRFSFDYPSSMQVQNNGRNEVKVFHPGAGLRIMVSVEKRKSSQKQDVKPILDALKKQLEKENKEVSILKEGKHLGVEDDSQGYLVCAFKDERGLLWVQLVQYFLTKDSIIRLIISDRAEGFKNLLKVVARVHESFTVATQKPK
ncbi:MAG: hypothetical protein AB1646_00765 [Thermodesulfobacteriota bacterium]